MTRIGKTTPRYWTTEAERIAWTQELSRPEPQTLGDKIITAMCWILAVGALATIMLVAMSMGPK